MKRTLNNTVAVLIATVFTALAVFTTVTFAGTVSGTGASAVNASTTEIATAASPVANVASNQGNQTLTCPRTGCTASSCHAAR